MQARTTLLATAIAMMMLPVLGETTLTKKVRRFRDFFLHLATSPRQGDSPNGVVILNPLDILGNLAGVAQW